MNFLLPVRIGQLVLIRSAVNRVFRSSMEVGVKVFVEDLIRGEVNHMSSAYLTFVAVDRIGKPTPVGPVIPESEKRRYAQASERREYRLRLRSRFRP